jgi:hypothetical protein
MSNDAPSTHAFFEQDARARSTRDVDSIASQYADPFMLADPKGARVVQKASLLRVFPNGLQLLRTHGHTSTNLRSLSEDVVDEHYRFARAQFVWCFENPGAPAVEVDVDTTFMVYVNGVVSMIVFQQEREDFRDALRSHAISLTPA